METPKKDVTNLVLSIFQGVEVKLTSEIHKTQQKILFLAPVIGHPAPRETRGGSGIVAEVKSGQVESGVWSGDGIGDSEINTLRKSVNLRTLDRQL